MSAVVVPAGANSADAIAAAFAALAAKAELDAAAVPSAADIAFEHTPWTEQNGMLTGSMKKRRAVFAAKYA